MAPRARARPADRGPDARAVPTTSSPARPPTSPTRASCSRAGATRCGGCECRSGSSGLEPRPPALIGGEPTPILAEQKARELCLQLGEGVGARRALPRTSCRNRCSGHHRQDGPDAASSHHPGAIPLQKAVNRHGAILRRLFPPARVRARAVRAHRADRRPGDGGSLARQGHPPRPQGRRQDPARRLRAGRQAPAALRARGADDLLAQPSHICTLYDVGHEGDVTSW